MELLLAICSVPSRSKFKEPQGFFLSSQIFVALDEKKIFIFLTESKAQMTFNTMFYFPLIISHRYDCGFYLDMSSNLWVFKHSWLGIFFPLAGSYIIISGF